MQIFEKFVKPAFRVPTAVSSHPRFTRPPPSPPLPLLCPGRPASIGSATELQSPHVTFRLHELRQKLVFEVDQSYVAYEIPAGNLVWWAHQYRHPRREEDRILSPRNGDTHSLRHSRVGLG
ncbi:unnamed protein product [Protopolystoma xenopodis]|uniref:Uncharacterized protein n=1 Tax=Protopolystoma xenopodis TaxID=117903 RepID=A0A3S5A0Q6_9PLAT|nr:unnamed protein product [Protopolystoma xenopodis]